MYRENGKLRRERIGKVSKATATIILRQFEDDLALKKIGVTLPKHISIGMFMDEYMVRIKQNQAKNPYSSKCVSRRNITKYFQGTIKSFEKNFQLHELSTPLIEKYKRHRCNQQVNVKTINKELNFISSLIKTAKEWGYVVPDVTIKRYQEVQKEPRYFSHSEIHLLRTQSSQYVKQIIMIGLNTGMRIGEILNLQWDHIDLKNNRIVVSNTDTFSTKNKKDRPIPINSELKSYLEMLQVTYMHPSTGKSYPRSAKQMKYVICKADGAPIKSVKKSYRALLHRLGIKSACIHTLRHTFASNCVMSGVDLYTVRDFLGHASIKMTEIYAHLSHQFKQDAIEKIVPVPTPAFSLVKNEAKSEMTLAVQG